MTKPMLYVDFNEMLEPDLVLLSTSDTKTASNGALVTLEAGQEVTVYMDDIDEHGNSDNLVATGIVEANKTEGWGTHVKWCCRIDANGILHQSKR
ncbi:hypothetical protein [Azovibrio restrictus]|uniref:hypothetical protein n=1 Tax=Azovibrio restrictus TaxID=146938 RepID=UPI00047ED963|nr:hypothetical protein [Azovibrio restrictus]